MADPKNKGMEHPAFIAQQWKKGQSGNPKGRPKRPSLEALAEQILDERIKDTDVTKREFLVRVLIDECLRRNSKLLTQVLARLWPAPQKHEINGTLTLADWIQKARGFTPPGERPQAPIEEVEEDEDGLTLTTRTIQ